MKVYRTSAYYSGKSKPEVRLAFTRMQFAGMLGRDRHWSRDDTGYNLGRGRVTLEVAEIPDDAWTMERDERGPDYEGEVQLELPFEDLCNVSE